MVRSPRKSKYDKVHVRSSKPGFMSSRSKPFQGFWTIRTLRVGLLKGIELESGRRLLSKFLKKRGKVWVRSYNHLPFTGKISESRMGKGKGSVKYWALYVRPGTPVYDLSKVSSLEARGLLKVLNSKLSIPCEIFKN